MAEREIDLLQRELKWMIRQQTTTEAAATATEEDGSAAAVMAAMLASSAAGTPTPKKRKGNFKRSRLKLLKKDSRSGDSPVVSSSVISAPSGRKGTIKEIS